MVAPCGVVFGTHALLDYSPFLVFSQEECVMVELIARLNGGVVNFGGHFALVHESLNLIF